MQIYQIFQTNASGVTKKMLQQANWPEKVGGGDRKRAMRL